MALNGEYLHFRCLWHEVKGHFEVREGFAAKCEVIGCDSRGRGYWYRGEKWRTLPEPDKAIGIAYG